MRYRSAAFALKSAHALAGPGSTHFPARGVDADALLSPAAVLYLLRFSGDIITAEQTFVTGVVPPVRVVATVVLVAFVEIVRIDVVRPTLPTFAVARLAVLPCKSQKFCVSCAFCKGGAGSVVGRDGTHFGLCIAL